MYILSDIWVEVIDTPWLDKSLSVVGGRARDISPLDKSLSDACGKYTPWPGKSLSAVEDTDDTPGFGKSASDAVVIGNETPWLGESASDAECIDGDTLRLGESLSDEEGKAELAALPVISLSDDVGTAKGNTKLAKSFHCWATVLIWV